MIVFSSYKFFPVFFPSLLSSFFLPPSTLSLLKFLTEGKVRRREGKQKRQRAPQHFTAETLLITKYPHAPSNFLACLELGQEACNQFWLAGAQEP